MNRSIGVIGLVAALIALCAWWTPGLMPSGSSHAEKEAARPGEGGRICLWSAQGPVCVERHAGLRAAGEPPGAMLAALLEGPTAEERARGLRSAIPEGTTLVDLDHRADGTVIVRLAIPAEALRELDHASFEVIVHQIGGTLEPLGWRDLRIRVKHPESGAFVPLADFLPEIPPPRKGPLSDEDGESQRAPAETGQPPAPGQGQPQGALTGRTVYVSAGHGWLWNDYVNGWRTQRPPYPNPPYEGPIIEDHNNAEAVNQYLLRYLWNAGAMVWPVRERDMNDEMIVIDNDDPPPGTDYCETGAWITGTDLGYGGGDHRQANTVTGAPTATASWSATLPDDGRCAVYVWYRPGSNRAPDAHYTIDHAGGETTVTVDQRHHGITWHYVGTYGFLAGEEARVTLTNESSESGRVVVADAVRFGGGTFDDLSGIDTAATHTPDEPWWEVAALYHVQRMGMTPGSYFNDVVARPMYARWEHKYTGDDAVYVSWHTNGISGYQTHSRGTLSIVHNGDGRPITPGSEDLRDVVHNELVQDIRAGWDASWPEYKRWMNLGELRELWDSDVDQDPSQRQIAGALFEIAYHDHPDDTDALKEPTFEMLAARAMYQGIVKYFEQRDGIDLTLLPEPPTHLAVENVGGGAARVSWEPSPTDGLDLAGDAATGYRVYTSANGVGWSDGVPAAGTSHTLTGLSDEELVFVRVSAVNDGGESFPTETLAVRVGDPAEVVLVNGFDRLNDTMAIYENDPVEGENVRLLLDRMNRYDYVIQHAEAISYPLDSASNEAVQGGSVALGDYAMADWILGEESAPDETLNATERSLVAGFLESGGALFISGSELGWHLDDQGADPDFYNARLRADYVGDDAGTYGVAPVGGSIFAGLGPFRFDAPGMYDADWPDQLAPINGSTAALAYDGGLGGTAAVQYENGCERVVTFGFPFETIWPEQRPAVMARVLGFLDQCLQQSVDTAIVSPGYGSAHSTVPPFAGTARARNGSLQRVEVQIERVSDGHYWTGSGWSTAPSWPTAAGTEAWSYALPTPLNEGDYHLRARAWTTDGVGDPSPAETTFTYDTIPPASTTLITPTGGVTIAALPGARLVWEDVGPDGGSALLYRVDLDGQPYTTTHASYTVTGVAEGPHSWGVQVLDAAGHRSARVSDAFSVSRRHFWVPLVLRGFEETPAPCSDVIADGGFETGEGWTLNSLAVYEEDRVHGGARSARVGIPPGEPGAYSYSSVSQTVALPAGGSATLRLWVYPIGEALDPGDNHYVGVRDQENAYHALDEWRSDARTWEQQEYDLSAYLGQTVTLYVGTKNDGDDEGNTAAMYVDDVVLEVCP